MREMIDSCISTEEYSADPCMKRGLESVTYPEVIRIHMDLLRVLLAQLGVSILDVVQVLHSPVQPTHHCLAVSGHLFVCDDGGVGGNVAEACEVSLSPWVDDQKPGMTWIIRSHK